MLASRSQAVPAGSLFITSGDDSRAGSGAGACCCPAPRFDAGPSDLPPDSRRRLRSAAGRCLLVSVLLGCCALAAVPGALYARLSPYFPPAVLGAASLSTSPAAWAAAADAAQRGYPSAAPQLGGGAPAPLPSPAALPPPPSPARRSLLANRPPPPPSPPPLPASVDWAADGFVTPVVDQGACGAPVRRRFSPPFEHQSNTHPRSNTIEQPRPAGDCYVFVAVAAVESAVSIAWGTAPLPLSKQQVLSCLNGTSAVDGCDGGDPFLVCRPPAPPSPHRSSTSPRLFQRLSHPTPTAHPSAHPPGAPRGPVRPRRHRPGRPLPLRLRRLRGGRPRREPPAVPARGALIPPAGGVSAGHWVLDGRGRGQLGVRGGGRAHGRRGQAARRGASVSRRPARCSASTLYSRVQA